MIVYSADKGEFIHDNDYKDIDQIIHDRFRAATGKKVAASELRSWKQSLNEVAKVLRDDEIPQDLGVAVEFVLPQSAKRIDVTLAGHDDDGVKRVVIIELKQWSEVTGSQQDAIVVARFGKSQRRVVHPSYQAWSYAAFLQGFNEAVYDGGLALHPCAYLHNYEQDGVIDGKHYDAYLQKAPLFLKGEKDREKLRSFIKQHVRKGSGKSVLYELEQGRIRPSKALADSVVKLLKGNPEFTLLDDQKEIYEAALSACRGASTEKPRVVIVEGGPGTGKSVVAVNLLAAVKDGLVAKYVSKNAAPRAVYLDRLAQEPDNAHLAHLFTGSGAFMSSPRASFDVLIVDEAHRLTEKSGLLQNMGEHQVKEVINAAKCAVFFIDEDQRISMADIGSKEVIRQFASMRGADVEEYELASQFRCAGSDGYLAWLDNTLGIRETANDNLDGVPFDFQVFDDPASMHAAIEAKNDRNRARVVAGYCWPWKSKRRPSAMDVVINDYERQWNLDEDGSLWIVSPDSVKQVGCIHTCQGLEVDYVGVIIGPDMVWKQDRVATVPRARDRHDRTMRGYVKMSRSEPQRAAKLADRIIKNTYKTLMTRGMKGATSTLRTARYGTTCVAVPCHHPLCAHERRAAMVIHEVHPVRGDLNAYATHRLRLYKNPDYAADYLIDLHRIPAKHHKNAHRQASEIRYCLTQAEEYLSSAKEATLATKPVLLYYGLMSLALAEVLTKKTGDHRLAKLREQHGAHGLSLVVDGAIGTRLPLAVVCSNLHARTQAAAGGMPYGTFEVWRTECRECPIPGVVVSRMQGGISNSVRVFFAGSDAPPARPSSGVYSLMDAIQSLPQLGTLLAHLGVLPSTVRATARMDERLPEGLGSLSVIVHPAPPDTLQAFYSKIQFSADAVNYWNITELPSGVIMNCQFALQTGIPGYISFPPAVVTSTKQTAFVTNDWNIGEFGSYYVAAHICGNLARYYPDVWMQHVDSSSTFSLLVDELCELALRRAPVLIASELDRRQYVAAEEFS